MYHLQFVVSSSFWALEIAPEIALGIELEIPLGIELEQGDSRVLAGEKAVLLGGSAECADTVIGFTDIIDIISIFRSK